MYTHTYTHMTCISAAVIPSKPACARAHALAVNCCLPAAKCLNFHWAFEHLGIWALGMCVFSATKSTGAPAPPLCLVAFSYVLNIVLSGGRKREKGKRVNLHTYTHTRTQIQKCCTMALNLQTCCCGNGEARLPAS